MSHHPGYKKEQKISKAKYYSPKRRAAMAAGEEIDPVEIFDRDEWICGICNELVERHRRCPDPLAATLDHRVPLSKWTDDIDLWHRKENVRCSHKICNEVRSDDLDPESSV